MREPTVLRYISIVYRYSQIHISRKLKSFPIGSGQYPFILAVCRNPGISQDGISERLVIDKGTTAKAVKALEKGGYIERRIDETDRRAYKLYVTREGRKLRDYLDRVLLEWSDCLWKDFGPEERDITYKLVERMARNARDYVASA